MTGMFIMGMALSNFESDPRVLTSSIHRRGGHFYPPGSGIAKEVGTGPGKGFNVNLPWRSKGVGDADYMVSEHRYDAGACKADWLPAVVPVNMPQVFGVGLPL